MRFGKILLISLTATVLFVLATPLQAKAQSRPCPGCPLPVGFQGWHPTGALRHQFQLQGVPNQFCSTG